MLRLEVVYGTERFSKRGLQAPQVDLDRQNGMHGQQRRIMKSFQVREASQVRHAFD